MQKYKLLTLPLLLGLVSCSETEVVSEEPVSTDPDYCGRYVDAIGVSMGGTTATASTRADLSGLGNEFVKDKSIIYISQYNNNLIPFSTTEKNFYQYYYDPENFLYPNANWDDGYNFFPEKPEYQLDWEKVREEGPHLNGYWFYAMYFPVDNEMRWSVETDQSVSLDAIQKSDIMGAIHTTSTLNSRLRFKLYHLMVCLKVTLYVPVFRQEEEPLPDGSTFTGFSADAVESVTLLNVYPDFNINWQVNTNLDGAPFVNLVTNGKEQVNIPMYRLTNADGSLSQETTTIKIHDFITTANEDETDEVYVYNYLVMFPQQPEGYSDQTFLRFLVKPYVGEKMRSFVFSGAQFNGSDFMLNQGNLQNLSLYLPRTGSNAVLVSANLVDWTDAQANLHLNMQEPEVDEGEETPED